MTTEVPEKKSTRVRLRSEWLLLLQDEFEQPYMAQLSTFLRDQRSAGREIYPAGHQMFAALEATPPSDVRVVVLGQDPYHGPNQAHGLAFSVVHGQAIPPSLRNIFSELSDDIGIVSPNHGHLQSWAEQGVLLLNTVLSVEAGCPGSHQGRGWERFTDAVIAAVSADPRPKVFMLWGAHARKKRTMIDKQHCVLEAPHPSPLSAHRGFFGCRHFSKANAFLVENGRAAIDWQLPNL